MNELWQTDFTYFKIQGWGRYYLSTVLDDYSRYSLAWKLTPTMAAPDVQETLELALARARFDRVRVRHRPRLLSDNGPCYVSRELRRFLESRQIEHTRGAPYHPMTQGKIERYHRSMKNLVQLQNYAYPWELEREISSFVDYPGLRPRQATITSATTNRWATSRRRTPTSGEPRRCSRGERRSSAERSRVVAFRTRSYSRQPHDRPGR